MLLNLFAVALGVSLALLIHNIQRKGDIDNTTFALHLVADWSTKLIFLGGNYPQNNTQSAQFTRNLLQHISTFVASKEIKDVAFVNVETDIYGPDHIGNDHFIRIFHPPRPRSDPAPILIYFFPGAWMLGGVDTSHEQCAKLALRTNFLVMCPDYRQAPEFAYPAAFLDAYASVRWAYTHGGEYNGDVNNLFIVGESAGANLAAAVTAFNVDREYVSELEYIPITAIALVYGPYAPRFDTPSCIRCQHGILTIDTMKWGWQMYSANQTNHFAEQNYTFAPLYTPDPLLEQFPPTIFSVGRYDVLFDDSADFANKLRTLGIVVKEYFLETAGHMYFGRDIFSFGDSSLNDIATELLHMVR